MLYVDDFNRISNYSKSYPTLDKIFSYARGHWFCKSHKNVESSVNRLLNRAKDAIVTIVIYNISHRDMNGHSAGGAKSNSEYLDFISQIAKGIKDRQPIIIFEPDAIPHAICHATQLNIVMKERFELMKAALDILATTNAKIYIDIGHPRWLDWKTAVNALSDFDKKMFNGFSINVSNFVPLDECLVYGQLISKELGKSFIIDTSRNGNDKYENDWCNPTNALLGKKPTLETGLKNVDGFLWVKIPGESDGRCNGGPNAGKFWPQYAQRLLHHV